MLTNDFEIYPSNGEIDCNVHFNEHGEGMEDDGGYLI